jgi:hypothetical protein
VHEQRAGLGLEQQVLGAAREAGDALAFEQARELLGYGPAQSRLAHLDTRDRAAHDVRREAAARGFDFGQLRHGASLRRERWSPNLKSS